MKKIIAIIVCKLVRMIGKLVGKGSSLPGQIALKVDPNILNKIKLPKYVIAVSGSNGKTSTVEMIREVLVNAGYKVAYNAEGSNQIEGVTTLLLSDSTLSGKSRSDVILLESDERYARYSFKYIKPTHYIISNLYRDQLTRNGNPEWIYAALKESVHDETKLLLNADDPLISLFGKDHMDTVYYGIDKYDDNDNIGAYDDGVFCPNCKHKMIYNYRHFSNIGDYKCDNCGHQKNKTKYTITEVNLKGDAYLVIDDKYRINLALKSIYNAYNLLATYSLCKELNIEADLILKTLNNYVLKNGRVTKFKLGENEGTLLTSKHENSTSYNQSISVLKNEDKDLSVLVLVDAISRKYFTSETSWLWDIDFDGLNQPRIKNIVLAGLYASDLAERFEYTNIDQNIIYVEKDIQKALDYLKDNTKGYKYVLTCFSDMHKVLDKVEVIKQ